MKTRKKTPEDINDQFMRIAEYNFHNNDRTNDEVRERVADKVKKLYDIRNRYIDNIYRIAGVEIIGGKTNEVNEVWLHFRATKEQYTNNK